MAKFKIEYTDLDKYGNKVVTVNENGQSREYIISPKDKKTGNPFPDFDKIMAGFEVVGNAWTSPANGKGYIFPIDETKNGTYKPKMEKMMEQKQNAIQHSQDNKAESIKISSTIRMALDKAIAEQDVSEDNILKNRAWFWEKWDAKDSDFGPF